MHTFHPRLDDFYGNLFDTYKVEEIRPLQKLIWQVHKLEINLGQFLVKTKDLKIKDFEEKIWPQILRYDFLPLADVLGIDLNEWVKFLPIDLQISLADKIISVEKWADGFILSQNLNLSSEGRRRLIFLANEYLKGSKTGEEIKEQIIRSFKVGGLELTADLSEIFLNNLESRYNDATANDEIFTPQIFDKKNISQSSNLPSVLTPKRAPSPAPKAAIASQITPVAMPLIVKKEDPPFPKTPTNWKKDTEELQKSSLSGTNNPQIKNHDQIVEEIIKKSGVVVSLDLLQRFKMILISRLKEVRKLGEVKERLVAHTLNGGLGLAPEVAAKVLSVLEDTYQRDLLGFNQETKPEKIIPIAPSLIIPTAVSAPVIEEKKLEIKPINKPVPSSPVAPSTVALPKPISPIVKPKITPPPTSSDITPVAASAVKITEAKGQLQAQKIAPLPPPFRPSINAVPQTPSGRAKVEDIAYTPRLVGPIEELKEMSLLEFRRLSPKPQTAADKIISKIDLLTKENYNKKIQAIEAWRRSPLIQNYNAILSTSLNQGKTVAQILKENQGKKQETLSEEEFKVIMELNRRLQF